MSADGRVDLIGLIDREVIDLIDREIRNVVASVGVSIANRKAHPTYGYTKASIRADLDRAIGLGQAAALLTGSGSTASAGVEYIESLGIDVRVLRNAIKGA